MSVYWLTCLYKIGTSFCFVFLTILYIVLTKALAWKASHGLGANILGPLVIFQIYRKDHICLQWSSPVCVDCLCFGQINIQIYSWPENLANIFMNEYIHLEVFKYSNKLKYFICRNSTNSTNECLNIFVALKSNK